MANWNDLNNVYASTEAAAGGDFRTLPVGDHRVFVRDCRFTDSTAEKDARVWIAFASVDDPAASVTKTLFLDADPRRVAYWKKDLLALGYQDQDLRSLPVWCSRLSSREDEWMIRVTETEKGGKTYKNTWINERFPADATSNSATPDFEPTDDDIPF